MTAALSLPGRISPGKAASFFSHPRWRNLYGLLAPEVHVVRPGQPETRQLPCIERVWMPAYAVRLRTAVREKESMMWVSVDAWSDYFSILEAQEELAVHELQEEVFPPKIDEAQAADISRKGLMRFILAQRGQINKPTIESVEEVVLYYYPVYVYYGRRFGKYLDIKVLDGYTGKSGGAKMRISVLDAFVAQRKGSV